MADDKELLLKIKGIDELSPVMIKAVQSMEVAANKLASSIDKINPPMADTKQGAQGLNTGMINLAAGVDLVRAAADIAIQIWSRFGEQIGHAVDEAVEAEKSINQLNGALVSQGLYTEDNIKSVEKYVQAIEAQTGAHDEVIRRMIAMGVQAGLTVQQSKEMEEAARKLAVATGTDVSSAFSMMQGALAGHVRGLAKVIPGVKELTQAQLKNGEATRLVNDGLEEQYKLYLGSFSGSVDKAKNSIEEVYKSLGNIIIQNPLVIQGLNSFTEMMKNLKEAVLAADAWVKTHEQSIINFGKAVGEAVIILATLVTAYKSISFASAIFDALTTSVSLYGVAGTIAANTTGLMTLAVTGLKTALTFLTGPIGLILLAVTALTAAFYKWPGLFSQIMGGFKGLVGIFLEGLGFIINKTAALAALFDKDLAKSLGAFASEVEANSDKMKLAGVQQIEYGEQLNKTSQTAVDGLKKENGAIDENLKKKSDQIAKNKEVAKSYDDIIMGTTREIDAVKLEASVRDEDLKNFTAWLEAKKNIAIDQATARNMAVDKIAAEAIGDNNTSTGRSAKDTVELDAETKKQSDLKVLRDKGILDEEEYQQALVASQEKYNQIKLRQEQEHQIALADAMGNSEAGFQLKQQVEQENFMLSLDQRIANAQEEDATEEQIQSLREQAMAEHLANQNSQQMAYYDQQAAMQDAAGNHYEAYLNRIKSAQVLHGTILGAMIATQQTQQFKGIQQGLTNLSTLMDSHSKKAFEVGKAAALANAIVGTAAAVVNALAVPPFPLGIALAVTAAAAGLVQIQKISSQQYKGGQADEGMDSIPESLGGKSFILSQGERVVQPAANRDLTAFLDKEKDATGGGGGRGGQTINITLNYGGLGTAQDARSMAEILVKEIRSMSERGSPILNEKGIVKNN